jgi:dihydrophenazinedicarboxylate synthase
VLSHTNSEVSVEGLTAFDEPPPDPIALFRSWVEEAQSLGVKEVTAAALATTDANGRPSIRMIRLLYVTERGFVFSSHSVSQKGRDAQATGVGAAVFYWPETGQQISMSGALAVTPEAVSDRLWADRPSSTYPMSVATTQSAPLLDEAELRGRAAELMTFADSLPRPATWVGYELVPDSIEFWHTGTERLHLRLRYDIDGPAWKHGKLQP